MNLKEKFIRKKVPNYKVHFEEDNASEKTAKYLYSLIANRRVKQIVFVCIGTDRSTGDALGPIIGTKLSELEDFKFKVYGTLERPVHAVNLEENCKQIQLQHPEATIIAIDACLSRYKNIGYISIGNGSVKPGAGVHKSLPAVGDIYMNGIVNTSGTMEYFVLQNTRLHFVMTMAEVMAKGIMIAMKLYDHQLKRTHERNN